MEPILCKDGGQGYIVTNGEEVPWGTCHLPPVPLLLTRAWKQPGEKFGHCSRGRVKPQEKGLVPSSWQRGAPPGPAARASGGLGGPGSASVKQLHGEPDVSYCGDKTVITCMLSVCSKYFIRHIVGPGPPRSSRLQHGTGCQDTIRGLISIREKIGGLPGKAGRAITPHTRGGWGRWLGPSVPDCHAG